MWLCHGGALATAFHLLDCRGKCFDRFVHWLGPYLRIIALLVLVVSDDRAFLRSPVKSSPGGLDWRVALGEVQGFAHDSHDTTIISPVACAGVRLISVRLHARSPPCSQPQRLGFLPGRWS